MNKYLLVRWMLVLTALPMASVAWAGGAYITVEVVINGQNDPLAARDWMKALSSAGANDVRVGSGSRGAQPTLKDLGTKTRPSYKLVGVVNKRGQIELPGGRFERHQVDKIHDYFVRLGADGSEGVTAQRGRFGLTKIQTKQVTDDLSQQLGFATTGLTLSDVLKQANELTKLDIRMDDGVWRQVRTIKEVEDELRPLTVGTALAILLKQADLALVPTKPQGEEVNYQIVRTATHKGDTWPVGWKPERSPGELSRSLTEEINVEIAGYTLAEAMDSIEPRIGLPVYWDYATLRAKEIDPTKVSVRLPRQRARIGRIADRVLFQARLRGEVMVDEVGTPFYWISR